MTPKNNRLLYMILFQILLRLCNIRIFCNTKATWSGELNAVFTSSFRSSYWLQRIGWNLLRSKWYATSSSSSFSSPHGIWRQDDRPTNHNAWMPLTTSFEIPTKLWVSGLIGTAACRRVLRLVRVQKSSSNSITASFLSFLNRRSHWTHFGVGA